MKVLIKNRLLQNSIGSVSLGTCKVALVTDPAEIIGRFQSVLILHKEWI